MMEPCESENHAPTDDVRRIYCNTIVLSVAFMLYSSAFQGINHLRNALNSSESLETTTDAVIHSFTVLSAITLSYFVIKWLGFKWTIASCIMSLVPYVGAQLQPSLGTLVPTAMVLGVAKAPLWVACYSYLTTMAKSYSQQTGETRDQATLRFFGIFTVIFTFADMWGHFASSYMFFNVFLSNNTDLPSAATFAKNVSCGVNYEWLNGTTNETPLYSDTSVYLTAIAYLSLIVISSLIVCVCLNTINRKCEMFSETRLKDLALDMCRSARNNKIQLLAPIAVMYGMMQPFSKTDFNEAFVLCHYGVEYFGFFMTTTVFEILSAAFTPWTVKFFGRVAVTVCFIILHAAVLIGLLAWDVHKDHVVMHFVTSAILGVCHGFWTVLIKALYGFMIQETQTAFGHFIVWENVGFLMSLSYSAFFPMWMKTIIVLVSVVVFSICYLSLEQRVKPWSLNFCFFS